LPPDRGRRRRHRRSAAVHAPAGHHRRAADPADAARRETVGRTAPPAGRRAPRAEAPAGDRARRALAGREFGIGLPGRPRSYANPDAPYMAQRLASPKFSEPILNTPRSITVLTKEVLADKNATTLREVARTTAA